MKKTVFSVAAALALTTSIAAPAQAADRGHKEWIPILSMPQSQEIDKFTADPIRYLVGLLLPAVQAAR